MIGALHRVASRLRRSRLLRPLEPLWLSLEPAWNGILGGASKGRGYEANINGDRIRLIYAYGSRYEKTGYESAVHAALDTALQKGSVMFDVGAHIGILTIAAAQRVGPSGKVFAFEAAPATAAVLRRHVDMNNVADRVIVVDGVVTDREGTSSFFVYQDSMAASISEEGLALSPEHFASQPDAIEVPAHTLDAIAAREEVRPDLVKVDVEGAELLVLRGMPSLLPDPRVAIICEVHPDHLATFGNNVSDFEQFVASFGRVCARVDEPNPAGIYHVALIAS